VKLLALKEISNCPWKICSWNRSTSNEMRLCLTKF